VRAYKLFRQLKSGELTSLFVNRRRRLPINHWLKAESYPTKGLLLRPFWHCTPKPIAPHLSERGRVWAVVEIEDYEEFLRPATQGEVWYLARRMKILGLKEKLDG
jgi:hypothetical protein